MRVFVLGICLLTAACSGQNLNSPVAPTALAPESPSVSQAGRAGPAVVGRAAASLPFNGTFTLTSNGAVNCPPTCPPTTLTVQGRQTGNATHLGRFTAASVDLVNTANATATGTMTFTAANGDQLFATTAGAEDGFTPPNLSHVTLTGTIRGGTGRFADATGTFTMEHTSAIDFASGSATGSGSFDGHLDLNR